MTAWYLCNLDLTNPPQSAPHLTCFYFHLSFTTDIVRQKTGQDLLSPVRRLLGVSRDLVNVDERTKIKRAQICYNIGFAQSLFWVYGNISATEVYTMDWNTQSVDMDFVVNLLGSHVIGRAQKTNLERPSSLDRSNRSMLLNLDTITTEIGTEKCRNDEKNW